MGHVAEPTSTPVRVAHTEIAVRNSDGVVLQMPTARRTVTVPLEPVLVVLPQPYNHQLSQPQHQHVRLQLHPQHPPRTSPATPPAAPTTVELHAWAALSAIAVADRVGVDRLRITADQLARPVSETVVVTTPQAQARQSPPAQHLLPRLPPQAVEFSNA